MPSFLRSLLLYIAYFINKMHCSLLFTFTALVYSLPNYAENAPLNNFDIKDNIAFVDRGKVCTLHAT